MLRFAGARPFLEGKVERGLKREYGREPSELPTRSCPLFKKLPGRLQVWNSHSDKLTRLPKGFNLVATTGNSDFAAVEDRRAQRYGLQFHPEVVHTPEAPRSSRILSMASVAVAKLDDVSYLDQAVTEIREQVGQDKVILGLSGGVDSSVAAAVIRAVANQLTCIFVNNGLLRYREEHAVRELLRIISRCACGAKTPPRFS